MYGKHNSSRHHSYKSRALGQSPDPRRYKKATGWETREETRLRTEQLREQAEIDRTPEGVDEAIRRLRQRYETIRTNPDLTLKIKETRVKIMRVRDLIQNFRGKPEQRSDFFAQLAEIEANFAQVGHKM